MSNLPVRAEQRAVVVSEEGLIDQWLDYCRDADTASRATLATYRKSMGVFVGWLTATGNVGAVTSGTVVQFKGWLQQQKYSAQTVNLRLSAVRSFYRWAVVTERLAVSPAESVKGAKREKGGRHKRDALTNGEVLAVLATCGADLVGVRDRAMLTLMAYCGLRVVEVQRLDIGHLRTDSDRLVVAVQGKGRREADEVGVIPRDQEHVIRAWLAHRLTFAEHGAGDALFVSLSNRNRGARLTTRAIRGMVNRRFREAGVVGDRKSTHSLRHSAITNLIRRGAAPLAVMQFARHMSFDTTLGYFHEVARTEDPPEDLISYDSGK